MFFTFEEIQVFHFGVIVKLFSFLSCSKKNSSFHCIFLNKHIKLWFQGK
jgi:hypothetical protein